MALLPYMKDGNKMMETLTRTLNLEIQQLPHARGLPAYATEHSAGMDLIAAIVGDIILAPMERVLVPTGFIMALPEGYEAQIRPRSGLAYKNGITVLNAPGTIDADYRGEVKVLLINLGSEPFTITAGMRIAQMVITPYTKAALNEVETVSETVRGAGGFGSTGA
jgi:dUTP pyrophosphatase